MKQRHKSCRVVNVRKHQNKNSGSNKVSEVADATVIGMNVV